MSPQEALAAHLKTQPQLPHPIPPLLSPAYKKWQKDLAEWQKVKETLESALVPKMDFTRMQPTAKSSGQDYIYL